MFRARTQPGPRRGVILLVVVALLTLFAIVGLTFVLYAEAEAKASLTAREAESQVVPNMDPELLLAYFLGQMIYDVPDDSSGVYSALRGHSLARLMYGSNDDPNRPNDKPFTGVGRLHTSTVAGRNRYPFQNPYGQDDYEMVNYMRFPLTPSNTLDGFVRDPERLGPIPKVPPNSWFQLSGPAPQGSYRTTVQRDDVNFINAYFGGANVPYTYPDLNNMFLASVRADGAVLLPSYHRPWTDEAAMGGFSLNPASPNYWKWNQDIKPMETAPRPWLKYKVLRPRPADNPGFPPPEDGGGDVKNLSGSPGTIIGYKLDAMGMPSGNPDFANNDSIWLDLGHPVITGPDGRRYKPMFAPLIIDLDNRLNANVHGNIRRRIAQMGLPDTPTHASNQGWGPWEVSLRYVLNADAANDNNSVPLPPGQSYWRGEWANLFLGAPVPDPAATGTTVPVPPYPGLTTARAVTRYGGSPWNPGPAYGKPGKLGATSPFFSPALPFTEPHFYARVDYDGADETMNFVASGPNNMTLTNSNVFPPGPSGYGNGNPAGGELTDHPLLYDLFQPSAYPSLDPDDRVFGLSNLEALLRYGDTNAPGLTTDLFRLCPRNFSDTTPFPLAASGLTAYSTLGARRRNLLTTHSFDVDRPALTPYVYDPVATATPAQAYTLPSYMPGMPPTPALPFPTGQAITFPQPVNATTPLPPVPANSEFASDYRGQGARVFNAPAFLNLLQKLDLNRPLPAYPDPTATASGVIDVAGPTGVQFRVAQIARQQFAREIYDLLRAVSGADVPSEVGPGGSRVTPERFNALRFLAQLAVNIVDYLDSDENSTPFNWFTEAGGTTHWVYGTELPRVLINEVDATYTAPPTGNTTVAVTVELFNPLNQVGDTSLTDMGAARLMMTEGPAPYAIYRLMVCRGKNIAAMTPGTADYMADSTNSRGGLGAPVDALMGGTDPTTPPPTTLVYNQAGGGGPALVNQWYPVGMPPPPAPNQYTLDPMTGGPTAGPDPDTRFVLPDFNGNNVGAASNNRGYYVVGAPSAPVAATLTRSELNYDSEEPGPSAPTVKPTVLLQRLACPRLPLQPDVTSPFFNPYVTVDFMAEVTVHDATTGASQGRNQPFAGEESQKAAQAGGGPPANTFFNKNSNGLGSFEWLIHLDRSLRNPMEVLHVSGYRPSQLTQRFVIPNPVGGLALHFRHRAPWFDEDITVPPGTPPNSARLYRALEFFATRSRALGLSAPSTTVPAAIGMTGAVTVTPAQMRGVSPSGVPWKIMENTTLILEPGTANQENIVATAVTATGFTTNVLKTHPASATLQLTTLGDRVPGKVNINTIWDHETLEGLCDPQTSNGFYSSNTNRPIYNPTLGPSSEFTDFNTLWARLVKSRRGTNADITAPNQDLPAPNNLDTPFWSLTTGTYDPTTPPTTEFQFTGFGRNNTLLRDAPAGSSYPPQQKLFAPMGAATDHPAIKEEILAKIGNHLTTRSNVFGVWLTVGFFEVTSAPGEMPPKLGAEIGRAENRHVRHRMFAILDRTNLLLQQTADPATWNAGNSAPAFQSAPVTALRDAVQPGNNVLVRVAAQNGTTVLTTQPSQSPTPPLTWHLNWNIQGTPFGASNPDSVFGSVLLIDAGTPNEEMVVVRQVNDPGAPAPPLPNFRANFTKAHARGASVSVFYLPGNPGPQPRFDYKTNTAIVPYASVIK